MTKKPNLKHLLIDSEKSARFRKPGRSIAWWLQAVLLMGCVTITLLWIASFPIWTPVQGASGPLDPTHLPVTIASPDWRDVLRVRIAIDEIAIQQQRGFVQWQTGTGIGRAPLTVITDNQMRSLIVPVGLSPDWSGEIRELQISFPRQQELTITLAEATLIRRSPFALDALLERALAPWLPALPSFSALALVMAALLSALIVLTMPKLSVLGIVASPCCLLPVSQTWGVASA